MDIWKGLCFCYYNANSCGSKLIQSALSFAGRLFQRRSCDLSNFVLEHDPISSL